MLPKLRPYQLDDLDRIVDALNNGEHGRVLYQAPTGSGKTTVFADLIAEVVGKGDHELVLAHRDEIVQQVSTSLNELAVGHGIIAPGYAEPQDRVQVPRVFTA